MANVITWVQNQKNLAGIGKYLERKVTPKTPLSKVADKLEKAYHKNDVKELVFWLAYAKVFNLSVKEGRKFFKKIEELWPLSQAKHPELANKFHLLNKIYAQGYTKRNNSAQICNYTALLAEFSLV